VVGSTTPGVLEFETSIGAGAAIHDVNASPPVDTSVRARTLDGSWSQGRRARPDGRPSAGPAMVVQGCAGRRQTVERMGDDTRNGVHARCEAPGTHRRGPRSRPRRAARAAAPVCPGAIERRARCTTALRSEETGRTVIAVGDAAVRRPTPKGPAFTGRRGVDSRTASGARAGKVHSRPNLAVGREYAQLEWWNAR